MFQPTHLLITHGSRNPKSAASVQTLLKALQPHLPKIQLFHVQLEGTGFPLHQQILQLTQQHSLTHLHLHPLFLIPGIHITEDLPVEINLARQTLPAEIHLISHPYLGEQLSNYPNLFPTRNATARILLTHGSKQPDSLIPIEALAQTLNAIPAYYTIEPKLATQLQTLTQQGHITIQILNHFLFPGTITDTLQAVIHSHALAHPHQTITLTDTLSNLPNFPPILAQILETRTHAAP